MWDMSKRGHQDEMEAKMFNIGETIKTRNTKGGFDGLIATVVTKDRLAISGGHQYEVRTECGKRLWLRDAGGHSSGQMEKA